MKRLDLAPYQELIKQRCGLILEGNNADKLATVLAQRSAVLGCADPADYYTRLYGDHTEFQELVNLLTINETYFFREPEQLELLTGTLAPRLLAQRDHALPLRILSAGCSSGEEPYSILMALREKYPESADTLFAVAGGDIDTQVLAKARGGCYGEFSFRGVASDIKARYFDREPYAYRIKEDLRRRVEFHQLNLLVDSYPATLGNFDVIFFRNVSIYFDTPTRRLIQRNLATLLKDDGYLVIGTAETLANDLGELALVEENGLFYFVKPAAKLAATAPQRPAVVPA
ncbi:MAG: protein-glutamate O-methyltransferase CheR, partial [Sulfuricella sp.]|nr:protein-glutamate O-methyltransferase CheR [Sulfuricella sp.]